MKIFLLIIVLLSAALETKASGAQLHTDFVAAVRNGSTGPYYVKIWVNDLSKGVTFSTCVTANLLRGAIHRELGLSYTEEDRRTAYEYIIARTDHNFSFGNQDAVDNFPPSPTSEDLSLAARLLNENGYISITNFLNSEAAYSFYKYGSRHSQRASALACALIDKGYRPRSSSMNATVYVDIFE